MSYLWINKSLPGKRYELVLVDYEQMSMPVVKRSGYISDNMRDILKATWYLNGNRDYGLTERQKKILDTFK